MFGLAHIDMAPLFYGVVLFIGLMVWIVKWSKGMYFSLAIDILVFWFVFSLHGGTMTGGMAATVAAILAGVFFPLILRSK